MGPGDDEPGSAAAGTAHRNPRRGETARKRRISPLTLRVIVINLIPVVILFFGFIHLDSYQESLIKAELRAMSQQAELLSQGIAADAFDRRGRYSGWQDINAVHRVMRRYVGTVPHRVEVFDRQSERLAQIGLPTSPYDVLPVPILPSLPLPVGMAEFIDAQTRTVHQIFDWLPRRGAMRPYREKSRDQIFDPDVREVLASGRAVTNVSSTETGGLMLSVAVPIKKYRQIKGALMLSMDGAAIDRSVRSVRARIVVVFLIVFAIALALSIYQAGTIIRPIRRLAAAAERVRAGRHREYSIPEFPGLRDEIGDLAGSVREMTENLWQRMDVTEKFAADAAHEIKSPLASIRSAVETAMTVEDPVRHRDSFAIILDDVSRIDRLVSEIFLAFAIDAELSRKEVVPVDISAMVSGLCDAYDRTGRTGAVDLRCEAGDGLLAYGAEDSLVQVFRNLIDNALSFSRPDGQVRIRVEAQRDIVVVVVDDDGVGIPEGSLESIFDRFYSQRPAGEKFGTHSGLGLSISRQIVEAYDGSIVAKNRFSGDGRLLGARFVVSLPRATEPLAAIDK